VYGQTEEFPQKETQRPNPISPYAVSKLAAENYCITFAKIFGLETVSLRYFNVFGPRQSPESKYSAVIPAFIDRLLKDLSPEIYGDGRQCRDFTFITDVVEATLEAVVLPEISGEVINIARGESISVLEVAKILNKILKKNIKPKFCLPRPGDVRKTQADITKMKRLLKFKPEIDFQEGLRRTVEWFISRYGNSSVVIGN
jgi:UDP-glucose 4-epimerase